MRGPRPIGLVLATGAILAVLACSAFGAVRLTIPVATQRGPTSPPAPAQATTAASAGRHQLPATEPDIVFCRTYLKRNTRVQGGYECTRLIRLAIDPKTHRVPVTGVGRNC